MTGEPDQRLADVAAVARAFLAATAETKPDTPRAELWHLLVAYRGHLAAVVGDRRLQQRAGGRTGPERISSRSPQQEPPTPRRTT